MRGAWLNFFYFIFNYWFFWRSTLNILLENNEKIEIWLILCQFFSFCLFVS